MSDEYQTSGPHIGTTETVSKSMIDVMLALSPAFVASVIFFGPYSVYLVLATAAFSTLFEAILQPGGFSRKRPFGDLSALAAGYILGLTLAPGSPWWIPILGAFLLVFVGKHAFGGLGNNIFNPALVARGLLLIGWPAMVTEWHTPLSFWETGDADVFTSATPLVSGDWGYFELFIGNIPGSIGETSALALIIGAVYLQLRGHKLHRIALGTLIGTAATAFALGTDPLAAVLSGTIMYVALYMATDFVSSPMGKTSHWIFGLGIGFFTVLIREFGIYPEGATFAVLLMNAAVYLIDILARDPKFGELRDRTVRRTTAGGFILACILFATIGTGAFMLRQSAEADSLDAQTRGDIDRFFPEAENAEPMELENNGQLRAERILASEDETAGYLIYSEAGGYSGPVRVVVALDEEREVDGIRIYDEKESRTLGSLIHRDYFLEQFFGLTPESRSEATGELEHISGATTSSRAVANAVESALGIFEEDEEQTEPSEELSDIEDGTYTGVGSGYGGDIELEVTVEDGRITTIEEISHEETQQIWSGAWDELREQILEDQTLDVDTVSGATSSSEGILSALEDALSLDD
ncbi:MAG: RnfABCDGE type electron transport complex subunit D [Spirochaetales bacterium]